MAWLVATPRIIHAPAAAQAPAVQAVPLTGPLAVDGRLAEPDWESGAWSTGFHPLNRPADLAEVQTRFKVRFDAGRLCVGIVADEPRPDLPHREVTQRDGPVYRDDCLEVQVPEGAGAWRTAGVQGDPLEVRLPQPVETRELRLLVTANASGQPHTVVYEVEAYRG
ncbi:MAG: hypothetical protein AB1505_13245 [Candidatus Latescibacterota bacterium]